MQNPFGVTSDIGLRHGVFADHARLIRSAFLFRLLELDRPVQCRLLYTSWWWRQKIEIDGQVVWFRVSWITIHRRAEFRFPPSIDPSERSGAIEIDFTRGLRIRRFRVWVDDAIVYDAFS